MIKFPTYIEKDDNGQPKSSFQLYQEAVNRANDSKKNHLNGIQSTVKDCYNEYESEFSKSGIHTLTQHGISEPSSTMLRSLYSSQSALIKRLRRFFNTELPNRLYRNTCPYCTGSGTSTIEHILPKEDYPEYAINTLNLIPCCGICNPSKGQKVKDDAGMPQFINFYYHDIESQEFLIADISFDDNGKPLFTFHLNLQHFSDSVLRAAIENHYENLHLLERYKIMADAKYAECEATIIPLGIRSGDIRKYVADYSQYVEGTFGKNHFYSAMLKAMVTSSEYQSYLSSL